MSRGDRGAYVALGLGVGTAIALFFFVWAFPWFSDPNESAGYDCGADQECSQQYNNPNESHFWVRPFYGWLFMEDSLAQWLMAVFGVVATGVSLWAVILVRDTLGQNRAATKAAIKSNWIARDTAKRQLRAYICLNDAKITEAIDRNGFMARITFANFGQTPAYDLRIRCREITIRPDAIDSSIIDLSRASETEPTVIGPTAGCAKIIDNILDDDELTRMQTGEFVTMIFGDVRYKDAFGVRRTTSFCLRTWHFGQPNERIGPCEFGNTAD